MNFFKKLFNKDNVSIQDVFNALDGFANDIKTLRNFSEIAFKYFGNNWKFNLEMYISTLPLEYKKKYLPKFKNVMEYERALSIWTSALQIIKGIKPVSAELLKSMPEYKTYLSRFGIEGERLFEKLNSMFDVSNNNNSENSLPSDTSVSNDNVTVDENEDFQASISESENYDEDEDVGTEVPVQEPTQEIEKNDEIDIASEIETETEADTKVETETDTEVETETVPVPESESKIESVSEVLPEPEVETEQKETTSTENQEIEETEELKETEKIEETDAEDYEEEDEEDAVSTAEVSSDDNQEYRNKLKERILQKVRDIELRKKNLETELAEKKAKTMEKTSLSEPQSTSSQDLDKNEKKSEDLSEAPVKKVKLKEKTNKKSSKSTVSKSKDVEKQSNKEVNTGWILQNFKKIQEFLSKSREIMSAISIYKNSDSVEDYKNYGFILDVIDYLIEMGEKILSEKSDAEISTVFAGGRDELRDIINSYKTEKNNEVVIPDDV